jgi:hypothetical protein
MDIVLIYKERTGGDTVRVNTMDSFEQIHAHRVEQKFGAPVTVSKKQILNCACVMPNGEFTLELTPLNAQWIKAHTRPEGEFVYKEPSNERFVDITLSDAPTTDEPKEPSAMQRKPRPRRPKATEVSVEADPVINV